MTRLDFSDRAIGALALAASVWVALLGFATWTSTRRSPGIAASAVSVGVYAAAALVCHQKPQRSWHWHHAQVPVCARCLGIYVAAAFSFGVSAARRPWRRGAETVALRLLAIAAGVNLATLLVEWSGGPASNATRAGAGALAGSTGAVAIAALARTGRADEVN